MTDADKVQRLYLQQTAIASFGSFALRQTDLPKVLSEAARVCAKGLDVPFSKVCRYRPAQNDLFVEAGCGWKDDIVGVVVSRADESSPQGRAFITGAPSICNDVRLDRTFDLPSFYAAHGIISTIDVLIKGQDQPYGVLEIDSDQPEDYDQHDIDFLTGFANVLAEAVATAKRTDVLRATIDKMEALVLEKDRLLGENKVMTEELHHRVRNNLQLIYGMVSKQMSETSDETSRRGLRAIARRVSTLAQVYDHLLGSEITRMTDFGSYLKSLCSSLEEIQANPDDNIVLTCESESIILDLDVVTALGIAVAELVTNCYDHAFPGRRGSIKVSARRTSGQANQATLIVSDDGRGYEAQIGSKRHGLGLVKRLVEQVRGVATVVSDRSTVWTIVFPLP